jgi:hypothetical protein
MSTLEASNPGPKWRLHTPKTNIKSPSAGCLHPRDVKNEGRTDYVYENKGAHDKMSCIGGEYFPNLTLIRTILPISRAWRRPITILVRLFAESRADFTLGTSGVQVRPCPIMLRAAARRIRPMRTPVPQTLNTNPPSRGHSATPKEAKLPQIPRLNVVRQAGTEEKIKKIAT